MGNWDQYLEVPAQGVKKTSNVRVNYNIKRPWGTQSVSIGGNETPSLQQKVEEQTALMIARKNVEDKFKKQKGKALTPAQISTLQDLDLAMTYQGGAMQDLQNDPELSKALGPIKGLVPPVIGQLPFIYGSKWAAWNADVDKAFQIYRKTTTGAQASDRELRMLRPLLPSGQDTVDTWMEKSKRTIEHAQKAKELYLNNLKNSGYDVSEFNSTGAISSVPKGLAKSPMAKKVKVEW